MLALDPAADAIEFRGHWHSWGELARNATALAAALDRAELPEGSAVGVLLRNHPAMIAALIALVSRNGCVVTLNPHQGDEKLARDIRDLELPAIVGMEADWQREALATAARESGSLGLEMAADKELREVAGCTLDSTVAHHPPRPGIAVQMLTSGTTGAPKRVELSLRAIEQSLLGAGHYESSKGEAPRLRSGIAIISAPLVHVGGLWRTLQCLADGRRIALLERFDVEVWRDLVRRHRPPTVSLVPTALRMVMEAALPRADLESIVAVVSGTAPLPPEEAERFEAMYGIPVLTTYGATEFAGGVAGWNLADHRQWAAKKRGSVGRAHPGCELRIVDTETGEPRATGEEGLLEVRSAQLGPDADWVRTTDLAHIDEDGFLFIHGRADAAIIRGGFKIHPDEVVKVLELHPGVHEAAVVGLDDARLGQVPVAAVTPADGAAIPLEDELRDHALQHLASDQVPVRIRVVEELPRTPSLKLSQPGIIALFEAEG
ncbi:MAG: long-chain fatty acid--CoA ligase [Deltaproteobacteria bacterium]|nr:long-chain fatty acid--CoA ligase [Deltaproteobacteria bacterium]